MNNQENQEWLNTYFSPLQHIFVGKEIQGITPTLCGRKLVKHSSWHTKQEPRKKCPKCEALEHEQAGQQ